MDRKRLSDILPQADRDKLAALWATAKDTGGDGPIPPGEYSTRIVGGALFASRSGTPGYKLTFEIIDGPHAGRRQWYDIWLTEAAGSMAGPDLRKLGVTHPGQLEHPLPSGILATIKVVVRRDDDGSERNRVVRFDPTGIETAEPEPFAPDAGPDDGQTTDADGFDRTTGRPAGEATP